MKFFVLLYINSPVFEKQIKSAKNKRCFISLQCMCVFVSASIFCEVVFTRLVFTLTRALLKDVALALKELKSPFIQKCDLFIVP